MQALSGINQTSIGGIFSPTSVDPAVIAAAQSIDRSLSDAEAEAQAAADSLNGASRGAATQGGPPDVDFTSLALETLQDDSDAQQQAYQDYYDSRASALTDPEYAKSRQDLYNFLVNDYKGKVVTGRDEATKAEDLNKGFVNSLIKGLTPFEQGPLYNPATGSMTVGTYVDRGGLVGTGVGSLFGPFGSLVGGSLGSGRGGYVPVNSIMSGSDDFGNPDMDMVSIPSQSELDQRFAPPDTGDDGDPDLGDPQQAAAAVAPTYVPPVYQTYAGLGLPSVSPIPPLRRVTVPISRFVV
jgi:hypothetical protein